MSTSFLNVLLDTFAKSMETYINNVVDERLAAQAQVSETPRVREIRDDINNLAFELGGLKAGVESLESTRFEHRAALNAHVGRLESLEAKLDAAGGVKLDFRGAIMDALTQDDGVMARVQSIAADRFEDQIDQKVEEMIDDKVEAWMDANLTDQIDGWFGNNFDFSDHMADYLRSNDLDANDISGLDSKIEDAISDEMDTKLDTMKEEVANEAASATKDKLRAVLEAALSALED